MLDVGTTCWRAEVAPRARAAVLVKRAPYLPAAKAAVNQASRSIRFLNWAFDPDTDFTRCNEPRRAAGRSGGALGFV